VIVVVVALVEEQRLGSGGLGQGQNGKLKFVGKRKCDCSSGNNVIRPRVGGGVRDQGARGRDKYGPNYTRKYQGFKEAKEARQGD
jgi:hypothetical protein